MIIPREFVSSREAADYGNVLRQGKADSRDRCSIIAQSVRRKLLISSIRAINLSISRYFFV